MNEVRSSEFDTLLWDFGDSSTSTEINLIHTYPAGGDYTVSLTVTRCGKSDVKKKTIHIESSVNTGFLPLNEVRIFPNPATAEVNVKLDRNYMEISVVLVDFSGKIILKKTELHADFLQLDVSGLGNGAYVLTILADEQSYSTAISIR